MTRYRVFIAAEVVSVLRTSPRREQEVLSRVFDSLAIDPFHAGDYSELDSIGRPINVLITGRYAIFFWTDHAVKEVKILDLRTAGH